MITQSPKIISSDGFLATVQNSSPKAWWKMNAPNTATGEQFAHGYLSLPGAAGYNASTPGVVPLRLTGSFQVLARIAPASWTATSQTVAARDASGATHSFRAGLAVTPGRLSMILSPDGSTTEIIESTAAPTGVVAGQAAWMRFAYVAATPKMQFYQAADQVGEPSSWTQVGADVACATASIFAGTHPLEVGSIFAGTLQLFSGRILQIIVKDSGGSIIFNADFTARPIGTVTFTESSVNAATVTVAGPVAADYVSPFSSEAIALNGAIFGAAGPVTTDPAMTFDGVNDQLVTQSVSLVCGQSALSVFGFIKTATTAKALMFSSGASNDLTFSIITNKLLLTLFDHTTTDTLPGSASVVDNAWHEVGFVISANHCQMYVDGLPDGGNTLISGTFAGAQAAVLRLMTDTTNFFNGSAQHWRVYQRALSAAEIARIYARRNIR